MIEKASSKNKSVTVMGIVVPVDWDEVGNPVVVAISTQNEQEFIIDDQNKIGKKMKGLLRQKIKVTGVLKETIQNQKKIRVRSYVCLEDDHSDEIVSLS